MLVVLDTNVLVAGLRSRDGASFRILEAIVDNRVDFALSVPLLLEYEAVLKRDELLQSSGLGEDDMDAVLNILCDRGKAARLSYLWRPQLKDEQDEMVLETAVNANADAIVTFNATDFLPAADRFGVKIISPSEYHRWLKEVKK